MLKRDYEGQVCSIARTLELVGERWSLLIIRDCVPRAAPLRPVPGQPRHRHATSSAAGSTGSSKHGIVERVRYQERPDRYEYRLTDRGRELRVPLIALMHWGDRYLAPDGPPLVVEHATCGGAVVEQLVCSGCGEPVAAHELRTRERSAA